MRSIRLTSVCCLLTVWVAGFESAQADITTGLVGHWKLNETSGTTASDSSGFGRNGTYINSPILNQTGQCAKAVRFNGTSNSVQIADHSDFSSHTTTGLTVSAWVRVLAVNTDGNYQTRQPIVAKGNGSGWEWALYVYDNGRLGASFWQQSGSSYSEIVGGTFTSGSWVHVCMTLERNVANRLYVNGQLVSQATSFSGTAYDGTRPVLIAAREDGQLLNADVDDVRIYRRALSATDLQELYSLLLHWKLNESSGTTAADSSTYERTGTVTGTSNWVTAIRDNGFDFNKATKIATPSLVGNPANFTIACWANTRTTDSSGAELVSVGDRFKILSHYRRYNAPVAAFWNGSTYIVVSASGGSRIGTGWHHYAVTFDDAANSLNIYVDGQLAGTTSTTSSVVFSSGGTNTVVGANGWNDTTFDHDGPIDDVQIYNRALTPSEIADLHGLIGHWKFDAGTGTTAVDSTGKANNAAFQTGTPQWIDGVRGKALYFNGSSDAITGTNFEPPSEGTVAFWLRSDGATSGTQRLLGLGGNWEVRQDSTGVLRFDLGASPFVGNEPFSTITPLVNPSTWYHVAAVYDSDDNSYSVYVDGVLVTSGTSPVDLLPQSAAKLALGTRTGSTERLRGALDDVRIYNRKLSAAEIAELYGLVLHLRLDELVHSDVPDGTSTPDTSGCGNNGAYYGATIPGDFVPYPGETGTKFGAAAKIQVPHSGTLMVGKYNTFTLACWLDVAADNMGQAFKLLGKRNDSGRSAYQLQYEVDGKLGLYLNTVRVRRGSRGWQGFSATNLDPTRPHHVCVTYDGSTVRWYIDGQLNNTATVTATIGDMGDPVVVGDLGASAAHVEGVDDVRIYNRALSHPEIAELYGLVGWWKLDETSGSVAADSSGMGNNGTLVGGTWVTSGSVSGAISLENVGEHIIVSSFSNDLIDNEVSLAGWVYATSLPDVMGIISKGLSSRSYAMTFNADQSLGFRVNDNTGGGLINYSGWISHGSWNVLPLNRWQHVAVTLDGSHASFYINGVLDHTDTFTGLQVGDINEALYLGRYGNLNFDGKLDDLRVYNRAMSAQEITALYDGGSPGGLRIIKWVEQR